MIVYVLQGVTGSINIFLHYLVDQLMKNSLRQVVLEDVDTQSFLDY